MVLLPHNQKCAEEDEENIRAIVAFALGAFLLDALFAFS